MMLGTSHHNHGHGTHALLLALGRALHARSICHTMGRWIRSKSDASLWCPQSITGSYTLQPKMQAIVNGFVNISNAAVANITAAENLASYASIHPFYLEVSLARIVIHGKCSLCLHLSTQRQHSRCPAGNYLLMLRAL